MVVGAVARGREVGGVRPVAPVAGVPECAGRVSGERIVGTDLQGERHSDGRRQRLVITETGAMLVTARSAVASSMKLTVPSVTGAPTAVPVAVNVTGCPTVDFQVRTECGDGVAPGRSGAVVRRSLIRPTVQRPPS